MTPNGLLGNWRLWTFEAITDEDITYPLGQRPGGYIGFSAGRFWVMLVNSSRSRPKSAALTDAEAITMMRSSAAYTGIYATDETPTADGIKVTIHVDAASNEAFVGTDRVFFTRLDGDRLKLKSPSIVIPSGSTSEVRLEFVRAE